MGKTSVANSRSSYLLRGCRNKLRQVLSHSNAPTHCGTDTQSYPKPYPAYAHCLAHAATYARACGVPYTAASDRTDSCSDRSRGHTSSHLNSRANNHTSTDAYADARPHCHSRAHTDAYAYASPHRHFRAHTNAYAHARPHFHSRSHTDGCHRRRPDCFCIPPGQQLRDIRDERRRLCGHQTNLRPGFCFRPFLVARRR